MRLVFLLLVVIIVVISPLERVVVVVLLSLASFLKALINFLLFILPVSSFFTTFSIAFVLGFRCTIDVKSAWKARPPVCQCCFVPWQIAERTALLRDILFFRASVFSLEVFLFAFSYQGRLHFSECLALFPPRFAG